VGIDPKATVRGPEERGAAHAQGIARLRAFSVEPLDAGYAARDGASGKAVGRACATADAGLDMALPPALPAVQHPAAVDAVNPPEPSSLP